MNGFTKKSVGTLTLGEKLKKLRSDKRLSLNDASRATRIQVSYLEYLEIGAWDRLPADVYVRGFLRSYADFLGVDEKIMLRCYEKERGIRKNLEKNSTRKKNKKTKPVKISSFVFTPRKILVLAVTVLVLAGISFLYRELDSFSSAPSLVVLSPKNNDETNANSIYVEGITDKDAEVLVGGQAVFVDDNGKFGENLNLQSGINTIDIKSINKFKKETEKTIIVKSNYVTPAPPEALNGQTDQADQNQANQTDAPLKMELHVDPGPVWLSVAADGIQVFSGTMLSGAVQSFSANDKITVSSGKGNATFVTLNGKDLGALSTDLGAVKDKEFTKDTEKTGQ